MPDVSDALPEEAAVSDRQSKKKKSGCSFGIESSRNFQLVEIMAACWTRQPERRPKLRHINQVISSTFESLYVYLRAQCICKFKM